MQKRFLISKEIPSSWWQNCFIFLIILYEFPAWYFCLVFCLHLFVCVGDCTYACMSLHLLILSTYFKSTFNTAWNQQLIHSSWICYIAISNMQQSVPVMWHKGTSVYISYCELQQVTQLQCKPNWQFILTGCSVRTRNCKKIPPVAADIQTGIWN